MKKQLRIIAYVLTLLLVLAGLWVGSAKAQTPTPPTDDQVNAIARQLYCPVCENTPLDVCPTEACRQWRELIRQQLSEGWTDAQIKQYFVANYGARVLAEPPRSGLNWLIYILPPAFILLGVYILYRALRTWIKPSTAAPASSESDAKPLEDEYVAKFEEELRKRN
ncbi:MAG TPA: cytochrome c-type biogenesis protein [Anaerolineales bacterium]|nr:cytochrome c-type biogenesis protein [Anaerolineales bacterium]